MKKQVPLWTLILTGTLSLFLLCGVSAASSGSNPEPKVITKTRTVTKEVKDESQTEKIEQLESQVEACKESTLLASQGFVDVTNAYVKLAEGASSFDVDQVERSTGMLEAIDAGQIGTKARECDAAIGSKITGLPE